MKIIQIMLSIFSIFDHIYGISGCKIVLVWVTYIHMVHAKISYAIILDLWLEMVQVVKFFLTISRYRVPIDDENRIEKIAINKSGEWIPLIVLVVINFSSNSEQLNLPFIQHFHFHLLITSI